jgi:hypothetical protein
VVEDLRFQQLDIHVSNRVVKHLGMI